MHYHKQHWAALNLGRGCVTPKQIANIQDQIGDLEGIDLDNDLGDILDGFDELTPESQDEVKYALRNGHVRDEIWKGVRDLFPLSASLMSPGPRIEPTWHVRYQQTYTKEESQWRRCKW